jgi:hypothetical protein
MVLRRVLLYVQNVPWLADYHGREQGLVGSIVPAVELDDGGNVAYVDDRDGEASEYVEAWQRLEPITPESAVGMRNRVLRELREHAAKRLLHGMVRGVRT